MDDKGISALIGIFLVLAIAIIFVGIIQTTSVPEWNKEIEAEHFNTLYTDMLDIRQAIERTASYELPQTVVVHSSLDYPSRMFLQNPSKPGTMISTFNDKKIKIFIDGNPYDNPFETINSCTIKIKEDFNYFSAPEFIIEHGMIIGNNGQTPPYTIENPQMNNKTINLDLVVCVNNSIGVTSSMNLHLFNLTNLIYNNVTIIFTTDYPDLWLEYFESIKAHVEQNPSNKKEIILNYSNLSRINITCIGDYSNCSYEPRYVSKTYTNNSDFDEGSMTNLNYNDVPDQLQINTSGDTDMDNSNYHFIWVPNTNLGTVSKVDTRTGNEVGRYKVNSNASHGGDPSRTTVDLKGDVWVGTRRAGTVVKIGDYESGNCLDRNGDGSIQTSRDTDNDGNIQGAEILNWGDDECVLYEVVLISGKVNTFIPGKYTGDYDPYYWGTSPRGLAIDSANNLWAGVGSSSSQDTGKYYYINETGVINASKTLDLSSYSHTPYGAVIDKNGILWSSKYSDHILRINTSNITNNNFNDIKTITISTIYGFCLDYSGHLFIAGENRLVKVNINGTNIETNWTKSAKALRGVVSTPDNDIWVAGGIDTNSGITDDKSKYNSVSRYDNNGNLKATISVFNKPSGVAVDEAGKVWVTDIGSSKIYRIDPATNAVDLTKDIIGSDGHYTYSDMTGFIVRTITKKTPEPGTWNVIFDSGITNIPWGTISWNSNEPAGISVKARSSNDKAHWSAWKDAGNGIGFSGLYGQYLEMETTLQIESGKPSPILYDLTARSRIP